MNEPTGDRIRAPRSQRQAVGEIVPVAVLDSEGNDLDEGNLGRYTTWPARGLPKEMSRNLHDFVVGQRRERSSVRGDGRYASNGYSPLSSRSSGKNHDSLKKTLLTRKCPWAACVIAL